MTLVGYLSKDPETRFTSAGLGVTNLSIPTSVKWKDKNSGEMREETEWHKVVFFGRNAENAAKYLKKGSCISVEGKLKTRKWNDKETGVERSATDIMGDSFEMFGERTAKPQEQMVERDVSHDSTYDDVPF